MVAADPARAYNHGMGRIIRRIFIIIPAVALEALWIFALLTWLRPWAGLLATLLSVMAVIFVLYLVTKPDEVTYRILWLLIILSAPIPGALLYLLFGNKRTTRPLRRALEANPLLPDADDGEAMASLAAEDHRLAETLGYIGGIAGFHVHRCPHVRYYPLGDGMFPDMLAEMEKASRFIFLEYFIIEGGEMWDAMVSVLARKAAEGVSVKVLYDDVGSIATYSGKEVRRLWSQGIECVPFNPLVFIKGTLNYRDHRKMLIIDGRVVFSGGINLADEYINRKARFGHWKDIGFRMEGKAVADYMRMFVQFWNSFTRNRIADDVLISPDYDDTDTEGYVLSYYDSPLRTKAASNELFIELLSQAREYAWFYTPYLILGDKLTDALTRAAVRGVDVRIIMPGIPDKKLVYRLSRSFYPVLAASGVRIFEYTPGFVHAKASVIDDRICTIGTVNLDYRSLFLHFENNSVFCGSPILKDLKEDYLATQALCREAIPGKAYRLTFRRWLVDGILRLFAPLC